MDTDEFIVGCRIKTVQEFEEATRGKWISAMKSERQGQIKKEIYEGGEPRGKPYAEETE